MAGTLSVQQIQGLATAADPTTVTIPTGHKLVAEDTAGIYAPGQVIQAVQLHYPGNTVSSSSVLSSSSGTFQDFLSKSITTKVANSKIYVKTFSMHYSSGTVRADGKLLRDSTEIDYCKYQLYSSGSEFISFGFQVLDSPNATAGTTITYKHQMKSNNSGTYYAGYGDSGGKVNTNMILMEIAA